MIVSVHFSQNHDSLSGNLAFIDTAFTYLAPEEV